MNGLHIKVQVKSLQRRYPFINSNLKGCNLSGFEPHILELLDGDVRESLGAKITIFMETLSNHVAELELPTEVSD